MYLVLFISLFVLICYGVWSGLVLVGFGKYRKQHLANAENYAPISVVVAFRNEADNLPMLLASLSKLDYPADKFEVILVDDHSTDDFSTALNRYTDIRVLTSTEMGKKAAQLVGVQHAKHDLIACTDADCLLPKGWLNNINKVFSSTSVQLAFGPVRFSTGSKRSKLEFMALIGSTFGMLKAGMHVMGNGANMAFKKTIYLEAVGNMTGNHVPTGDDVFLLHHLSKQGGTIGTMPTTSMVNTAAPENTKAFINQRVRWASKAKYYTSVPTILVGLLVLFINLFLLGMACGVWFLPGLAWPLGVLFVGKSIFDLALLIQFARVYKQPLGGLDFLTQQLLNIIYVPGIAMLSLFKSYSWKGRTY